MFKELNTLKPFMEEPGREFSVRETAKVLGISPATASKELKLFASLGILNERKERILTLYKANIESDYYRDLKIFCNIRMLRDSGLLMALNKFYLKPAVILFGSAASGVDTETSDFDLLVVSERNEGFKAAGEFEKKLGRKIHVFAVKSVMELKNEHLINNVLNGITIQGRIKWM
jgi:predicted nucleotidyltransferase